MWEMLCCFLYVGRAPACMWLCACVYMCDMCVHVCLTPQVLCCFLQTCVLVCVCICVYIVYMLVMYVYVVYVCMCVCKRMYMCVCMCEWNVCVHAQMYVTSVCMCASIDACKWCTHLLCVYVCKWWTHLLCVYACVFADACTSAAVGASIECRRKSSYFLSQLHEQPYTNISTSMHILKKSMHGNERA